MFPILTRSGQVVGFTGRDFGPEIENGPPKYFNTRETPLFSKGDHLFGINLAHRSMRETGKVHLVEGNADVLRLHQIGKSNSVCSCGTSLTNEQIDKIIEVLPNPGNVL